jgi:hypothetical protein
VVSKIIKHGREANFGIGTLLGLDFDGTMEVSNSFPLPAFAEEEDKAAKTAAQGILVDSEVLHFTDAEDSSKLSTASDWVSERGTRGRKYCWILPNDAGFTEAIAGRATGLR